MTGQRSRISRIGTVVVPVAEQSEALAFYTERLGFEVRMDGEFAPGRRWIEVAPEGAETTIALVEAGDSAGIELSLASHDAAADHARLLESGVDADPELIVLGAGVPPMFIFRDPDGNPFRVVERE